MDNSFIKAIDAQEFQQKVLDYISSDELDKMINNTVFAGKPECKSAIVYGMAIASMLTSTCEPMYINNNKNGEKLMEENNKVNVVTVRWWDGYKEDFRATEVRFGSDLLWMRLEDGNNRHIPLRMVRWFGTSIESHQNTGM